MLEYSWLTMLCYFQVYSKEIQLYIKKEKKKKKRKTETVHFWIIEVQLTLLIHLGDTG